MIPEGQLPTDHLNESMSPSADRTSKDRTVSVKTLLVTDLVDSTALLESLGDIPASELMERHDRRARDLLERFGGREIDKTDGFLLLFERPQEAVRYALAYHGMLSELSQSAGTELKARAGIHLGEILLRENSPEDIARGAKALEVEGLAKPTAARLMSLAGGGQTLLTQSACEMAQRSMTGAAGAGEIRWQHHGPYLFQGVKDAVQVYEVGREGGVFRAPPDTAKARRAEIRLFAGRWSLSRAKARAAALLVLVLAVPALFQLYSPVAAGSRPSLAVLSFKNLSRQPEVEWLSIALTEFFTAALAAGEDLQLVPGESVARARLELALPSADTLAPDTLRRIRDNLGTDYVLLGSYLALGDGSEAEVLVRLQDARRGETVTTISRRGSVTRLYDLVSVVGADLREKLGVSEISVVQARAAQATLSSDPEAVQLYSEGLAKLRAFDAVAARDLLARAVEVDPGFALAHSALGEAWSQLGYDARALASSERAFESAGGLPREQAFLIEGRKHEAAADWPQAIETYQRLWALFPDSVDHGLRLARAQTRGSRNADALETVEALRRLPPPAGEDPRIDLAEAEAKQALADFAGQLAATEQAEDKAREQEAWMVVAEARRLRGWALRQLGRIDQAADAYEEARRLYEEAGDRRKVALVLGTIGTLHYAQGDDRKAEDFYQQALAIHRQIGDRGGISSILNNLALLMHNRGELMVAEIMFEEALDLVRETEDRRSEANYLFTLSGVIFDQGDLTRAQGLLENTVDICEEIGCRSLIAWSSSRLGLIALASGEPQKAEDLQREALEISHQIGYQRIAGYILERLAKVLLAAGDPEGAAQALAESEAIRLEIGEQGTVEETRLARAELLLEQERPAQAEVLARGALTEFRKRRWHFYEADAAEVLARCLLAQGKLEAVRETLGAATAAAARSHAPQLRLATVMTNARYLAAAGNAGPAVEELERALSEAEELGLVHLAFEIRLALGEVEIASGRAGAGRSRLEALAREAQARGFRLISRKAAAAR